MGEQNVEGTTGCQQNADCYLPFCSELGIPDHQLASLCASLRGSKPGQLRSMTTTRRSGLVVASAISLNMCTSINNSPSPTVKQSRKISLRNFSMNQIYICNPREEATRQKRRSPFVKQRKPIVTTVDGILKVPSKVWMAVP